MIPNPRAGDPRDTRDRSPPYVPERIRDPLDKPPEREKPADPNPRVGDPRDTRERFPPYVPERIPDPLDTPPPPPRPSFDDPRAGDPHDRRDPPKQSSIDASPRAGDPHDHRDSTNPRHLSIDQPFQFPQYALPGQIGTSTHGTAYQFDGVQWHEGASANVAQSYIFDVGLIEAPPGTVNLEPATPTVIGGITEPPADGLFLRSAAGAVYVWTPAAAGTAYVWGVGLTETIPGTIDLDPATDVALGGLTEPPPDGLQYARSRDLAGVSTWVPTTAGIVTEPEPPAAPTPDMLWWDTDAARLYLWYVDGTAPCWVQIS